MGKERAPGLGLGATWWAAAFTPRDFFSRPVRTRSLVGPVWFAMIIAAPIGFATGFGGALLQGLPATKALGSAIAWLFLLPLLRPFGVYTTAAITQFWLMIARVKPRPFRETLECAGYSTAPSVLGVVPVVGVVIGIAWELVVLGLGLRVAHKTSRGKAIFAILAGPVASVIVALSLRAGVVEAFKIPSGSMSPTLLIGDHVFVNKLVYGPLIPWTDTRLFAPFTPQRSEVMVFKFPENKEQDFVKRAIAVPGDTLEVINGRPILNGWLVPHCHVGKYRDEKRESELFVEFLEDRSYLTAFDKDPDQATCVNGDGCEPGLACRAGICGTLQGPFKVAPKETWVMGDNRNNSHDSRSWRGGLGAGVPFENIKGRVMFIWMSFGPSGGIAQDRLLVDVLGTPVIPGAQPGPLGAALEKCLREKPDRARTTPPASCASAPSGP